MSSGSCNGNRRGGRGSNVIPLFAIDDKERLQFFQVGIKLAPRNGWQVYALYPAEENEAA